MNPSLTQLKELASIGMTQMASKKELEEILKAMIQIMKQLQDKNDTNATTLLARFQAIKQELNSKGSDIEKLHSETKEMLGTVRDMIPKVPDIMPLDNRLTMLELKKGLTMEEVKTQMPKDCTAEMQMMMKEMEEMKKKMIELEKRPIANTRYGGGLNLGPRFEIPAETPDGSRVTFTLFKEPKYVVADGATYFAGKGYTYGSKILTLSVAPLSFVRSMY